MDDCSHPGCNAAGEIISGGVSWCPEHVPGWTKRVRAKGERAKRERDYEVYSVYKVVGWAIVRATSMEEAVQKGLDAERHGVEFTFEEPYSETKMRARPLRPRDANGRQA